MRLTAGELESLGEAIDDAIELAEMMVRSELPPKNGTWGDEDRSAEARLQSKLARFSALRKRVRRTATD